MCLSVSFWSLCCRVLHIGDIQYVDVDLFAPAARSHVDGGLLYTTEFYMENALSMAFYFKYFTLPAGAAAYLINEEGNKFGPYTHETLWDNRDLQTWHLRGNRAQVQIFNTSVRVA